MSSFYDPKNDNPPESAEPERTGAGGGLRNFIATLAGQLPDRSVSVTVSVSPESFPGGGLVPSLDGVPVSPDKDEAGHPGVRHPREATSDVNVVAATPDNTMPGQVLVPPSTRFRFIRSIPMPEPSPNVPGSVFPADSYILSIYRVRPGGQVFWASLPPGTVLWVAPV